MLAKVDAWFGLSGKEVTLGSELRAGFTTFLTMSYILFVNPSILGQAITIEGAFPQLMTVTGLAAAAGCLMMGIVGRYPFALAPGMGLNAYFTYTVVLDQGVPWQTALAAVFLSGFLFLIISLVGLRETLIRAIPQNLKYAITAGIGCFLAMIGFVNSGLIVSHPVTLVTLGSLKSPGVLITLFGLLLTVVLMAFKIRGSILFGILLSSLIAIVLRLPIYQGNAFEGFAQGIVQMPVWPSQLAGALDFSGAFDLGLLTIVFTFLFVDFFDTAGTLIGLSQKSGILDISGNMPRSRAAFSCDAAATMIGAWLGTSSTTCYIESTAGIQEGGKTGMTAVFVGLFFLISLFFWPIASGIPAQATAPALILVGAMMMTAVKEIQWHDIAIAVPALLTILGMPLTYSITDGIALGLVTYALLHLLIGRGKDVHPLMYLLSILLVLRYVY